MSEVSVRSVLSLLRRAVVFELRLYRSLFRWLTRRPDLKGHDPADVYGYAREATPVIWLWIFASALEIPFVDLLIPWHTVRLVALALGAWGLVWMVGLLASLKVYPHLLDDAGLRVRHGASVDIMVPWEAVATVAVDRRDLPSSIWTLQPKETETGVDLQVAVSGHTNVHLALRDPLTVPTPKEPQRIVALSFLTDDARVFVTRAREYVGAASTRRDEPGLPASADRRRARGGR